MSDRARNLIVGITVVVAIGLLMAGIFMLGRFGALVRGKPYTINVLTTNANGVMPGSKVDMNGVFIGSVRGIKLVTTTTPPPGTNPIGPGPLGTEPTGAPNSPVYFLANVTLQIDGDVSIPTNAIATLGRQTIGTPFVSIVVGEPAATTFVPRDGSGTLPAGTADSGLFPKEVFTDIHTLKQDLSTLSHELTQVARDLHVLLAYTPLDQLDPKNPKTNISTLVQKLNVTVDGISGLMNNPEFQGHVREIAKNLADASAQLKDILQTVQGTMNSAEKAIGKVSSAADGVASKAGATLDATREQILKVSEKLVSTLGSIEKTTSALANGKGTTGRLINDPRLYDGLLDLTKSLKSTTDDLNLLIRKWKEEGLPLHLK